MLDLVWLAKACGKVVVVVPFVLLACLGLPALLGISLAERTVNRLSQWLITLGFLAALAVPALMLASDSDHLLVSFGNWIAINPGLDTDHEHYHFTVEFEFDRLSVPLTIVSFALCGTISGFAARYLHREPGYNRFFVLFSLFLAGMMTTSLANTIETLFAGWELVGLSSALLVAFYLERVAPARNGLQVWIIYRISDAALLLAAVTLHHMTGEGDFDQLMGSDPWPHGQTSLTEWQALVIGLLLLIAAAGKSALIPFSGWLPRAMEGPTPSSAIFYGALSVHLGAFLLLRTSPLIAASVWLAVTILVLGLLTALYAYLVGAVQTDIKSALAFGALTQVGVILIEIGLGHWLPFFWYIALTHLLGNALLRTLQFIRAPSLLRDYHDLENAIGKRLPRPSTVPVAVAPRAFQIWLYRFALERGYLDALLIDYLVAPFLSLFRWLDRLERRWVGLLNQLPANRREPTHISSWSNEPTPVSGQR